MRLTPDNHSGAVTEIGAPWLLIEGGFEIAVTGYGVTADNSAEYWVDDGTDPSHDLAEILQSYAG